VCAAFTANKYSLSGLFGLNEKGGPLALSPRCSSVIGRLATTGVQEGATLPSTVAEITGLALAAVTTLTFDWIRPTIVLELVDLFLFYVAGMFAWRRLRAKLRAASDSSKISDSTF
jgi:hypothetical protein